MAELFKFRCPGCGKLLGAPPRMVGRAIRCPQCGVEQVVPPPLDTPDPSDTDPDPDATDDEENEDAIDLGHLGIDLGLSLGTGTGPALRPAASPPAPRLLDGPDVGKLVDEFLRIAPSEPAAPHPPTEGDDDDNEGPDAEPIVATPPEPLVPGPRPRGRRTRAAAPRPGRDVVLPRTAVVAWSLFALLALGLSFVAGLMVGHYRWK